MGVSARLGSTESAAGARLPAGDSARLVVTVESALAGRSIAELSSTEEAALVAKLRADMARSCPGATARQEALLADLRARPRIDLEPDLRQSVVAVDGGMWLFWHTPSPTRPVIRGESFVPTATGNPVPKRPAAALAGITGQPKWLGADGKLTSLPPPIPTSPARAASGLDPSALAAGPGIILDEFRRARLAALDAAQKQLAPVVARTTAGMRHTGTRIARMRIFVSEVLGGEWDILYEIDGSVGREIQRLPSTELDKVLAPVGELGPGYENWARLHGFGPIFGDETLAGLAYGPHAAFNLMQKDITEAFARWSAKSGGHLNVKAGMEVKVRQYVKYRTVNGAERPFVRTVRYDFTLEDQSIVTAIMDITSTGEISLSVLADSTRALTVGPR
jgi:hypothetical protein